ncbi:MAG TPA: glutaredoxin [Clostridiales bacterium]|nr:glutaredoxin [Clostridiales bacterium]
MKIIMYGADICPDCVEAKAKLAANSAIELDVRDITGSTKVLKEFLSHRDHDEIFAPVIKAGAIGIPFFILEDNTKTFEIKDFLDKEETLHYVNSCSIDGKGC